MRIRQTLKPGQRGTQKLLARFGDRLVAVRYRYDAVTRRRLKTVELIVDEADWSPPSPRLLDATVVEVRIAWDEADLRRQVKQAGGRWNPGIQNGVKVKSYHRQPVTFMLPEE